MALSYRKRHSGAHPLPKAVAVISWIFPLVFLGDGCRPEQVPVCQLLSGKPADGESLVVALTARVDPDRAPASQNESERLLFGHLYETLVYVDCRGEMQPALAESWSSADGARTWIFTTSARARFSDGSVVTAVDVQSAWANNERQDRSSGRPSPWTWLYPLRIQVLDERRLSVTVPQPIEDLPGLLAHPSFRVGVVRPGQVWPLGTGPYRVVSWGSGSDPDIACDVNPHHTRGSQRWDRLVFRIREGRDPRDLPAAGADLLLVRDLGMLDYFRDLGYQITPLCWDRNYLLLVPLSGGPGRATLIDFPWDREDLARHTVLADGRASFGIEWPIEWGQEGEAAAEGPQRDAPRVIAPADPLHQRSILYPEDDPDARALAERIAADLHRYRSDQVTNLATVPRSREDFLEAVRLGTDLAYLFPLARAFAQDEFNIRELVTHAPWLMQAWGVTAESRPASDSFDPREIARHLVRGGLVIPLVLTRPCMIHRPGLAGGKDSGLGFPELEQMGVRRGSPPR